MTDFEPRNRAYRVMLHTYIERAEESFWDWGLMRDSDIRSPSYAQITATHSILPERIEYGWT
jgi:hypothetical protein